MAARPTKTRPRTKAKASEQKAPEPQGSGAVTAESLAAGLVSETEGGRGQGGSASANKGGGESSPKKVKEPLPPEVLEFQKLRKEMVKQPLEVLRMHPEVLRATEFARTVTDVCEKAISDGVFHSAETSSLLAGICRGFATRSLAAKTPVPAGKSTKPSADKPIQGQSEAQAKGQPASSEWRMVFPAKCKHKSWRINEAETKEVPQAIRDKAVVAEITSIRAEMPKDPRGIFSTILDVAKSDKKLLSEFPKGTGFPEEFAAVTAVEMREEMTQEWATFFSVSDLRNIYALRTELKDKSAQHLKDIVIAWKTFRINYDKHWDKETSLTESAKILCSSGVPETLLKENLPNIGPIFPALGGLGRVSPRIVLGLATGKTFTEAKEEFKEKFYESIMDFRNVSKEAEGNPPGESELLRNALFKAMREKADSAE